jgi:hypothetical protein
MAEQTPTPKVDSSNALYQYISNQNHASTLPSASALESLKLLSYFKSNEDTLDDDIKQLYNEETKYLSASIKMINNDPTIASKFGTDLSASMRLAGLLKEVYAEKEAKDLLLQYVDRDRIFTSTAQQHLRTNLRAIQRE